MQGYIIYNNMYVYFDDMSYHNVGKYILDTK